MRRAALLLVAPLAAACGQAPDPARPALWRAQCGVSAGKVEQAWLFGTVHALERPADWRGERVSAALAAADMLMVELSDPDNVNGAAKVWARLAQSPGHGPLTVRVAPGLRKQLSALLAKQGLSDEGFAETETWAAALTIAQGAAPRSDGNHGIDRAVIAAAKGKPVVELEGREAQLSIFDTLSEAEQRDLLSTVIAVAAHGRNEATDLAAAWRNGDMDVIAAETGRGMLADPELREALFTSRNRRWTGLILAAARQGQSPFVAVGAAHLAGPQGVPAMMRAAGCKVARVQ
jgi:uncharacterized protein